MAEAESAVAVFDTGAGANPGFEGVPPVFGDVNRDGRFDAADCDRAVRWVAGEVELEAEALDAGDLDLSGMLDERDVPLMDQTLAAGAALPSALLDEAAWPGGVVAMVSPALEDPDADIAVFVDGVRSAQVMRAVLGYATFEVPAGLVGEDTEVEVTLEADGVVAERLALYLKPVSRPPAGVSAKDDVLAFLAEFGAHIEQQRTNERRLVDEIGGLDPDETAVLLGGASLASQELATATAALKALLDTEGGDALAVHLQNALYANGLAEFRGAAPSARGAAAAASALSTDICELYVPVLCALKDSNVALDTGASIVTGLCTALELGSIVGFNPAALIAVVKYCTPLIVGLELVGLASSLVAPITMDMRLTSDKTVLMEPTESATIRTEVRFGGLQGVCGLSKIFRRSEAGFIKNITRRLLKRNLKLRAMQKALEKISKDKLLEESINRILSKGLGVAGLSGVLTNTVMTICRYVGYVPTPGAEPVTVASHGRYFNLQATNGASLTANADGTYRLACPANLSGTVKVRGSKAFCDVDKPRTAEVELRCNITNISPLAGLTNLQQLSLFYNPICDAMPGLEINGLFPC